MPGAAAPAYAASHGDATRVTAPQNIVQDPSTMLAYAIVFFIVALLAALFGFGGIAAGAAGIAKILFVLFIVLALASFALGLWRHRGS